MAQSKNNRKPKVYYSRLSDDEAAALLGKAEVDEAVFPDTYDIIQDAIDPEDGSLDEDPYVIALDLMDADPYEIMDRNIFLFVERVLSDAVQFDNDFEACFYLGNLYFDGHYGNQDYEKAFAAYEKAAENSIPDGATMYAWCLYFGLGTKKDPAKAFPLIVKQATAMKDPNALYLLAEMYWDGVYVDKDPAAAFAINMDLMQQLGDEDSDELPPLCATGTLLRIGSYVLNESYWDLALTCFQKAEFLCYQRLERGDHAFEPQLRKAQEGIDLAEQGMETSIHLRHPSSSRKH